MSLLFGERGFGPFPLSLFEALSQAILPYEDISIPEHIAYKPEQITLSGTLSLFLRPVVRPVESPEEDP